MILDYMKKENASFKSEWWSVGVKDLCDDESRANLISSWDDRDICNQKLAIAHKPIQEWHEKNNPCPKCEINKKDHWDDIHYNCELNHAHSCKIMIEHYEKLSEKRRNLVIPE